MNMVQRALSRRLVQFLTEQSEEHTVETWARIQPFMHSTGIDEHVHSEYKGHGLYKMWIDRDSVEQELIDEALTLAKQG